jgi:hypothetical protein
MLESGGRRTDRIASFMESNRDHTHGRVRSVAALGCNPRARSARRSDRTRQISSPDLPRERGLPERDHEANRDARRRPRRLDPRVVLAWLLGLGLVLPADLDSTKVSSVGQPTRDQPMAAARQRGERSRAGRGDETHRHRVRAKPWATIQSIVAGPTIPFGYPGSSEKRVLFGNEYVAS